MYVVETERCRLRKFMLKDAEGLVQLNAAPEVLQYTGDQPFKNVKEAEQFVKDYNHYKINGYGRWAIELKSTQQFIGWCGLKKHNDFKDLGYRIIPTFWNRGYATETAKEVLNYGFNTLNMQEIVARAMPENTASIAVIKKLGLTFIKEVDCDGKHNAKYYSITKSAFNSLVKAK